MSRPLPTCKGRRVIFIPTSHSRLLLTPAEACGPSSSRPPDARTPTFPLPPFCPWTRNPLRRVCAQGICYRGLLPSLSQPPRAVWPSLRTEKGSQCSPQVHHAPPHAFALHTPEYASILSHRLSHCVYVRLLLLWFGHVVDPQGHGWLARNVHAPLRTGIAFSPGGHGGWVGLNEVYSALLWGECRGNRGAGKGKRCAAVRLSEFVSGSGHGLEFPLPGRTRRLS